MKKVLIIAIVILSLLLAALAGLIWYQGSHVFVEGTAYAKNAEVVDLRGQNISEAHYLTVQQALPDSRVICHRFCSERRHPDAEGLFPRSFCH